MHEFADAHKASCTVSGLHTIGDDLLAVYAQHDTISYLLKGPDW